MQGRHFRFAGSILAADLLNLEREVDDALRCGIDLIHFDVMDFHYVPNLTFGPDLLRAMRRRFPEAVFDVHLMMSDLSLATLQAFIEAGASWLCVHPESIIHLDRALTFIREQGVKAGVVLNPGSSPDCLTYLWERLDYVLVMGVNPGFGGQPFIPAALRKAAAVRAMAEAAGVQPVLEVDGGIDAQNVHECAQAGITCFVVGSHFFGQKDRAAALAGLRRALAQA